MRRTLIVLICLAAVLPCAAASTQGAEPPRERVCFSSAETREKIAVNGLTEPLRLMRGAANRLAADAISARLCQRERDFVYDISLLKHDGHVVHVMLNARDGQPYTAREEHRGE